MKRSPHYLFLSLTVFAIASCEPDPIIPEPTPIIPEWKRFEGVYNVTKLESGDTYQLKISFDTMIVQPSGERHLHIIYENFDASFDSLVGFYIKNQVPDRIREFVSDFPESDNFGLRWSINLISQDPLTPELENTLVNDTILFYFRKSNIAFYFEDGVPYYDCYCKHRAVKVQ